MKRLTLPLFFCLCLAIGKAQNYDVRLIPDSLKDHANAVKRFEELRITIKSISKATIYHKWAITILNEAGEHHADYTSFYDKFELSPDVSGTLYDRYGEKVRDLKKKDLIDQSYDDRMSLVTDARVKHYSFYYKQYPYTVVYEEEQEMNGVYALPKWIPVESEFLSVQQSNLIVEAPNDYKFRYKGFNTGSPKIEGKAYTWQLSNYKAIENEFFQPALAEVTPSVIISPTEFEIGGYKGNMSDWLNLGKFFYVLKQNRDELPENVKQEIHSLTDGVADTKLKIKLLYEYLQKKTRYISIQLGVGGWQPFDAKYVASKGYGDCKALSNFMTSILKEAGIKANYVLITAGSGEKGLKEDFPSPYFNHAIMCVPQGKDTIWLECTSQTESAGFMGSFTGNRKALLIDEDGGHVVNTPNYKASDNQCIRKILATVDEEGNLTTDVNTKYTGIEQEFPNRLIHQVNKEVREKYLNSVLNIPTYSVTKIELNETKGEIPIVNEYLKISAPNYANITGKRLFIQPQILTTSEPKLTTDKARRFPIEFQDAFYHVDTVSILLPYTYEPELLPKDIVISNKFGKYSMSYKLSGNRIDVLRVYERESGTFPSSDYMELAKFYEEMYKADHSKVVLVRKEG
jgi:transglutaminase-like putative cysteine protease